MAISATSDMTDRFDVIPTKPKWKQRFIRLNDPTVNTILFWGCFPVLLSLLGLVTITYSSDSSQIFVGAVYSRPFWSHVLGVYGLMGHGNRWVLHFLVSADLKLLYAVEPPPTATSLHRPLFFVPVDSPYIDSYLNPSTTATATKASVCPTAKKSSLQRPIFSATDGKVKNG